MSPAFRAIRGANLFRCEWVPYLSEYVCNIWLRSDGRVERKGGVQIHWHEWVQDNLYGRSTAKLIVIKEPSLLTNILHFTGDFPRLTSSESTIPSCPSLDYFHRAGFYVWLFTRKNIQQEKVVRIGNGCKPAGTSEKWGLGGSKGDIYCDEEEKVGMVQDY